MTRLIGTKQDQSAAVRYGVRADYRRFDQKDNMIYQGEWNKKFAGLSDRDWASARELKVKHRARGFTRLDWAYLMAATANTNAARFVINVPNSGGTSWQGISRVTTGSDSISDLPEWNGDTKTITNTIKKLARVFGADDAGTCLLDRRWVYERYYASDSKESYPIRFSDEPGYSDFVGPGLAEDQSLVIPSKMNKVIVLIHEMDRDGIATAPALTHMATTLSAYSKISYTILAIAEFIRGLGFQAIPSANDTALNIPLAIDAGLGELGRNAKLIHPLYGPRCRISKVITDMPLETDQPISFGVTDFCNSCNKCARTCPSQAIPHGNRSYESLDEFSNSGVLQWQVDHAACRRYWVKSGTNCGMCLNACPYNKPAGLSHWLVKSMISLTRSVNPLFLYMDDKCGYGKTLSAEDFWEKFIESGMNRG